MSKKASPTAIGAFVVSAVALGVVALIIFGSGKLFRQQHQYILYFDSSVAGLNRGSAVKFRGVVIGAVVEVLIHHNQRTNDFFMPVIIEIDDKLVHAKTDGQINLGSPQWHTNAVNRGLRAKLDAESLVTGLLYIDLNIRPYAPPPVFHQLTKEYPEIPTVPTEIQELLSNLAHLDIRGISDKLNAVLARLDTTLAEVNMQRLHAGVTNLLASADRLLATPDLTNSISDLHNLLTETRGLIHRLDDRVDPLADSITNTLAQTQIALKDLQQSIRSLGAILQPDAPAAANLAGALDQLSDAARAVADLAEFLQRNPNALLTGRKTRPPKP